MLTKLRLILAHPRRYLPLALRYALRWPERGLSRLFAHSSFFLQERMDIHPRSVWHNDDFVARTGGFFAPGDSVARTVVPLEPWDQVRADMLVLLLRSIVSRSIEGDIAELGVYKGRTAKLLHHYMPDRMLHLFDTFAGFPPTDLVAEEQNTGLRDSALHYSDTTVKKVLRYIRQKNDNIRVHAGRFPESIPEELREKRFAFIHLDADLHATILAGLEFFYPRLNPGAFLVVHDYNAWIGPRRAVDDFFAGRPEIPLPLPDKNGSALIVKARNGTAPPGGALSNAARP